MLKSVYKVLDFILQSFSEFQLLSPLKALYCTLVYPAFEQYSISQVHFLLQCQCYAKVQRVQRKFLSIDAHQLNIPYPIHNYAYFLYALNIIIAKRQHESNLFFLYILLSVKIDFLTLLFHVNYSVLMHTTRVSVPLNTSYCSFNCLANSALDRVM